ncbi:MAG: hypothetical protein JO029_03545 [Candidatus Eremiobacteraeota bacterium]|nr:hypothetical protein [Candidatus Eremiobacteraeota bacterium]
MKDALLAAIGITVMIAQPLVTLSIGLETGGPQLRKLFAQPGLNLRYFLATFVVMPAIAVVLGVYKVLPSALWGGLALMSIAPPAPPATRKLKKEGDLDIGLAWQAEAFLISVVTIPLTVILVSGWVGRDLNLTWGPMVQRGTLFFAAPMALGLILRRYWVPVADAIVKPVSLLANVALLILVVLALVIAVPVMWQFGIVPIAIVTGFVAVAVLVGHLFGGPARATRVTLAAMLAARFPVPALVLAQANGATKAILPVVLVYVVAGVLLVPLYERLTARQAAAGP